MEIGEIAQNSVYSSINSYFDQAVDETKANNSINGDLNLGHQELEKKSETNVCCPVCNKKCLVSLIETHVERCLNKSNEFVVQTEIIILDDDTDSSAAQKTSGMSLDPRPEESPLNLNDRKQLIENIKKSLEECEIGQKEQHLLISVRRGYCFYDFTRFFKKSWNKSRWNFHYKFAFVGECGADEGGASREFYSGNVVGTSQPITEAFPGVKFEIFFIRSEK